VRGVMMLADDNPVWKLCPVEQARAACEGGASAIQLRAKLATDRVALEWAVEIRALTPEFGAQLFINDRFDLALLAEADGVHLGQDDVSPAQIPSSLRSRLAIGRSTHTMAQVDAAKAEPVDYIAFGPVFGTTSKESEFEARGLEALATAIRHAAPRPLIAIGGIEVCHLCDLRRLGVGGFAVISGVAGANDPIVAARRLMAGFAGSEV